MNFENVSLLSVSQENNKLDTDFTFSRKKNVSISGFLLDLQNSSGVKNIVKGGNNVLEIEKSLSGTSESLIDSTQEIIINGISYGDGYIESYSIDGDQIQTATYEASIVIFEESDIAKIILTKNEGLTTSLNSSDITQEDLKYLDSLDETFDFSIQDDDSLSVSHSVSCSFRNRKSLIPSRKNIWSGYSVQSSKLINLKNKGKGSIKVVANQTSSYNLNLQTKSNGDPQKYVLFFDYVGQNAASWGSASVDFGSESLTISSDVGTRKKIELNVTTSSTVSINLNANSLNDTFFDNFKLYKLDELPIEKSRTLANFLFNSSPNYSIISGAYQGKYKTANLFQNFSKTETFDEINLNYSSTKEIKHSSLQSSDNFSLQKTSSIKLKEDGFIEIQESCNIKALANKSESSLRAYVSAVEAGSKTRILNIFNSYNDYFNFGCPPPTTTKTPLDPNNVFDSRITNSKNFNFSSGEAEISAVFSNSPRYKTDSLGGLNYYNESSESLQLKSGNHLLTISGQIIGEGENVNQKNSAAKNGLNEVGNSIISKSEKIRQDNSISKKFIIVERNTTSDTSNGSISYLFKLSNSPSYVISSETHTSTFSNQVKNCEINISKNLSVPRLNDFFVNCKNVAQVMGILTNPKQINYSIKIEGFRGSKIKDLYNYAKTKINLTKYLSGESLSFAESTSVLNYSVSCLDFSECFPTPTYTVKKVFNWELGITPIPPVTPTPVTPTYVDVSQFYSSTPTEGSGWNYSNFAFATPTPEGTPTLTRTPTHTISSTQSTSSTETITPITETETQTVAFIEVFVPGGWWGPISKLFEGGTAISVKECLGEGGSIDSPVVQNISQNYAENTYVKDCIRDGPGAYGLPVSRFLVSVYSVTFQYDPNLPRPTPTHTWVDFPYVLDQRNYYSVDVPDFWTNGGIENIVSGPLVETNKGQNPIGGPSSDQEFVGGYDSSGGFQYGHGVSLTNQLVKSLDFNDSHPYFNQNVVEFSGPLIFKSLTEPTPINTGTIIRQEIPSIFNGDIRSLNTPTVTNFIVGIQDCALVNRHNLTYPTSTPFRLDEDVSSCNTSTYLRRVNSIYFKEP